MRWLFVDYTNNKFLDLKQWIQIAEFRATSARYTVCKKATELQNNRQFFVWNTKSQSLKGRFSQFLARILYMTLPSKK